MNSLVIILGILIVFLVYLLFMYLTSTASTITSTADFSKAIPGITNFASPTNMSHGFGLWLYVQNWDPAVEKTIMFRSDNLKLYLDKNTPTLMCEVTLSDSTATAPSKKTVMITNNFPLQKWVGVIISFDNQYLDCYLDGKLVISYQIVGSGANNSIGPKTPSDASTAPLYLGNSATTPFNTPSAGSTGSGWSANALLLTRWTSPVDPQTAWDWYMKGNGKSKLGGVLNSYGVNYSILKDNVAIVNDAPLF
jgi:hypothetical protein